jgi:YD repeat-containing protein
MVPPRRVTDARGMDLVSGQLQINIPLVSFGEFGPQLASSIDLGATFAAGAPVVNDFSQVAGGFIGAHMRPQAYATGADGSQDEFGPYESILFPNGSGLTRQMSPLFGAQAYHANSDGSKYMQSFGTSHFTRLISTDPNITGVYDAAGDRGIEHPPLPGFFEDLFDAIILANGEEWRFYREYVTVPCTLYCQASSRTIHRLRFITSSRGYGIEFLYQSDTTPASNAVAGLWWAPRRVTAYNKAITYCNESLLQECSSVSALPSAAITYNGAAHTVSITPPGSTDGVELTISQTNGRWGGLSSMRQTAVPNSTVSFQYAIDNAGVAYTSRVTDSDGQWNYTRITYTDDSGHIPTMYATSTNPAGNGVGVYGYGIFGTIQTYWNELGSMYLYSDGFPFRDNGRTEPEGDETVIGRDDRNNITAIIHYPKLNTNLQPVTLYSATYPVDCTNPRTCNHPITATDANNNVWSYTYAPEHGGMLTETGPLAPTRQSGGSITDVRPQKRYEYAQRYAWISNGSGGYMHGPTAIWLMTRERHCIATAASGLSCAGGAPDEVVTDYDYGPDSGPNNLLLRGVAVTAYVNGAALTRRSCYGYDSAGNRISETLPNANLPSCP